MADIVAKVFLGERTKFFRAADAFYERRREGPYRFIQNRPRTSVVALKATQQQRSPSINVREIFRVVRFSTFATKSRGKRTSTVGAQGSEIAPSRTLAIETKLGSESKVCGRE